MNRADHGHSPGNAGLARAFAETTTAQREPIADGADRLPALAPSFWHGPARTGFTAARDRQVERWRSVLDTHDAVVARVDGYNTFVHQLAHLWEAEQHNPAELHRLRELHRNTAADLARDLLRRAADLDRVAVERPVEAAGPSVRPALPPVPAPEPVQAPPPVAAPEPDQVSVPEPRESADGTSTNSHSTDAPHHAPPPLDAPEAQDAPSTLAQRLHHAEKLSEQIQTGVRLYRIPWEDLGSRARR